MIPYSYFSINIQYFGLATLTLSARTRRRIAATGQLVFLLMDSMEATFDSRLSFGAAHAASVFLLDWVLGGQHHEEVREFVGLTRNSDLALLHGLEQRCLYLGWGSVDLIGQDEVPEYGTLLKLEFPLAAFTVINLRAGHIRWQQVRRELNPAEIGLNHFGKAVDGPGFGQTGKALHQHIAVGQYRQDEPFDHSLLADDGLRHPFLDFKHCFTGILWYSSPPMA